MMHSEDDLLQPQQPLDRRAHSRLRRLCAFLPHAWLAAILLGGLGSEAALGANQTATVTPIGFNAASPFGISLKEFDFGSAPLPQLQSFAAGQVDGKWVLLAGRTNGLHDVNQSGTASFPEAAQNRDVWVIDPVSKQSWRRSLGDPNTAMTDPASGLTPDQIASLTPTNDQFAQVGDTLYVTGGYGLDAAGDFTTFKTLSAIDLPGLAGWVMTGAGHAVDRIRQITSPVASVTGGEMYAVNGRMNIVFGQDFEGPYNPRSDGAYTRQVRSFDVVDDGVNLAIQNVTQSTPDPSFRRRDLNVYPTVRPVGAGGVDGGLVALSGVFTSSFGVWTVPVVIDDAGHPSMADPNAADTFKQGFNNYHSAKLGLYSASAGRMDEVLFGGISLQTYDESLGQVVTDPNLPFVNDVTDVSIDAAGKFSQRRLGAFPTILDPNGNAWRFGAGAEFFLADGIDSYDNGVIKLDNLHGPTVLGYIFGGIASNMPNTQGVPGAITVGSYRIFEVTYAPVPESSAWTLACAALGLQVLFQNGDQTSRC